MGGRHGEITDQREEGRGKGSVNSAVGRFELTSTIDFTGWRTQGSSDSGIAPKLSDCV